MNTLQHFLPASFTDALGWTLLHSLWQGTLVAFVLGVMMILLRKSSARSRAVAASVALCTTALFAVLTFTAIYEPSASENTALDLASTQAEKTVEGTIPSTEPPTTNGATTKDFAAMSAEEHLQVLNSLKRRHP